MTNSYNNNNDNDTKRISRSCRAVPTCINRYSYAYRASVRYDRSNVLLLTLNGKRTRSFTFARSQVSGIIRGCRGNKTLSFPKTHKTD